MAADGTRMDADGSFPSSSVLRDRHFLFFTAARDATSGFPRLLTQDLSGPRGNRSHECTRSNPRPIRAILGHPRSRLFMVCLVRLSRAQLRFARAFNSRHENARMDTNRTYWREGGWRSSPMRLLKKPALPGATRLSLHW